MQSVCCVKKLQVHHGQENAKEAQLVGTHCICCGLPYLRTALDLFVVRDRGCSHLDGKQDSFMNQ
jgi:hypothetical protein